MARIVLILIACSVLMFAFVLQTPPQFVKNALSGYVNFESDAEKHIGKEKKPAPRQAHKTPAARMHQASDPTPTPESAADTTVREILSSPSKHSARPYVFCVASNGTTLYAHNSTNGSVVGVLQKGEIVEPELEINDAGQTWAFVNVTGREISGFLRRDSLERQQLAEATQ